MSTTPHIDTERLARAWRDSGDPNKHLLWDRELPLSPAAQAQVVLDESTTISPMPNYGSLIGVYLPWQYTSWIDESKSFHETCYLGDWSWLRKYRITGPDALRLLRDSVANDVDNFEIGQIKHIISTRDDGFLIGDGVCLKLADDDFLCTGGVTCSEGMMFRSQGYDVTTSDESSGRFLFSVQGPTSIHVIERAVGRSIRDIRFARFAEADIDGRTVRLVRIGMSGELGYEVHGDSADASVVWQALKTAGAQFGLRQLGLRTMLLNHLESYIPTQFLDYVPAIFEGELEQVMSQGYRSPITLGWGNLIDWNHEFAGREALRREMSEGILTTVTLEWSSEDCIDVMASLFRTDDEPYEPFGFPMAASEGGVPSPHGVFTVDGHQIGATVSRGYSVNYRVMLSIATIPRMFAEEGTELMVHYGSPERTKLIRATVRPTPYKPDARRVDVATLPSHL
ncbi:MAG TPA: hypothetical protein VNT50_01120 [Microbacterium sp.]|uniref:hypothetical protein n=1 Tax=Microbacterium sp. TaxID=51671 RepID=UPI002C7C17D9|nr:hypothetical protein [Microbacterium sp.]HWI30068.1 hypothetical protein [Microbacterium sp.]